MLPSGFGDIVGFPRLSVRAAWIRFGRAHVGVLVLDLLGQRILAGDRVGANGGWFIENGLQHRAGTSTQRSTSVMLCQDKLFASIVPPEQSDQVRAHAQAEDAAE